MKDSSGDLEYFRAARAICATRSDFALLMGPEGLLMEAMQAGAQGGVCGGANVAPRLFVELYESLAQGDLTRAKQLQSEVHRFGQQIYSVGQHGSAIIKGIKCALSCLGICDDQMAEPFQRFQPRQREEIARRLDELGIA